MFLYKIQYLAYTEFEAVLGQTSMSITVELEVVATSSPSSFLFFFPPTSCWSSGFLVVNRDSVGAGGEPEVCEAGEVGDAGEAGETGDGGDVGDGGNRGVNGGVLLTCTSLSRLSGGAGAAGGSGFFSAVMVTSSSWVGACFWAAKLTSY